MKKTTLYTAIILAFIACNNPTNTKENSLPSISKAPVIIKKDAAAVKNNPKDTLSPKIKTQETIERKDSSKVNLIKKTIVDTSSIKEHKIIKDTSKVDKAVALVAPTETVKDSVPNPKKIRPDHSIWNALTKQNVSLNGKVNYNAFKAKITELNTYLNLLATTPIEKDWTKNEKLAYWFNLYNASTVKLVTENYPVKSIKDINNGKPWDKKFIISGKNTYSLNEIENIIVRPNFDEPRLHVAFNCAAISCPRLLNEAFTANTLNQQLNMLSKDWVNDASKNLITENEVTISKLFDWYKMDFKEGILPFINRYSAKKVSLNTPITYMNYNWDLSE